MKRRVVGIVVAAGLFCAGADVSAAPERASILVYAAAGFRPPLEEAASQFERRTGTRVELTFAGSGCLIAQAELAGRGDVFIPGEMHYLESAQMRGIAGTAYPIAHLNPVIATRANDPHGIRGIADLARPGLRVGLGDPQSVAVGLVAERWLRETLDPSTRAAVLERVTTRALNVNELGSQIALGAIDAAIVWDVTVPLFQGLVAITPPESRRFRTTIAAAALTMSAEPERAAQFITFLIGPDGHAIFRRRGYEPVEDPAVNALAAEAIAPAVR